MLLDKTLLLKGVAGVAAVGGVVGGGYVFREELGIVSSSKKAENKPGLEGNNGQKQPKLLQQGQTSVDNKGIPNTCTDSAPCSLTLEDLKKIKFKDLDNGVAEGVEPSSSISLTLTITSSEGSKKYTFNNTGAQITLKKGESKTVILNASGTTEFTEEGNALKKVEGAPQALAQTSDVDSYGIPNKCNSNSTNCELDENDLKKIKFQVLEGGEEEVKVEGYSSESGQKITLTIDSTDTSNKRYIFNNPSSAQVTIKKGNSKTVTLKVGKTKFTVVGEKLKERELNNYGLPKEGCANSCTLTSTDLEDVKFEALNSGSGNVTVTPNQKVTLTIDSATPKKYKFNNTGSSAITITKGSGNTAKTVTLNQGTSEYKENGSSLKFVEPIESNGVPSRCKNATASSPCTLTEEELKNIKFKVYGDTGDVTVTPSPASNTITLSISPSGSTPKIYTFKNSSTSAITLKKGDGSTHSVTLDAGETDFKDESNKLVSYEDPALKTINDNIGKLKLPDKCKFNKGEKSKNSKECDVTKEELQKVEFSNKDTGDLNIELSPNSSETIKLEIKKLKNSDDKDQYGSYVKDNDPLVVFKNETSKITIKGKDNTNIIIPKGTNMEFLMKSSSSSANKLSKYQEGLSGSLPNSWGVTCTKESTGNKYKCDPTSAGTKIRFFTNFSSGTSQELQVNNGEENKKIFIAEENVDDYNQGFKFQVNEVITGTPTLVKNDCYEIKWSTTQKKWGFVKKSSC